MLVAVVCGVAVASIYAAQPVLEPMGRDLGVPPELTGWIVATGQFGYLAGLLLLVPLGDVVDRRRLIAVHLAVAAAGMIVTASASSASQAFVGLAAAGLVGTIRPASSGTGRPAGRIDFPEVTADPDVALLRRLRDALEAL
ncbi:hypothetical protein ACZ90_19890 [Streptomyces albus subsp. albus]|nr:hypothetical protein ACZ90_19890 [Streptomyces albus subsp. albus]